MYAVPLFDSHQKTIGINGQDVGRCSKLQRPGMGGIYWRGIGAHASVHWHPVRNHRAQRAPPVFWRRWKITGEESGSRFALRTHSDLLLRRAVGNTRERNA